MWHNLGITPSEALWVVLSALGIYAAFSLLVRGFGQRALASWSTLDQAIVIALGSVLGRVILGYTPTLAAGIIGLATMFGMLRAEAYLRRSRHGAYFTSRPILLVAGSQVLQEGLRKARILEDDLYFQLRQSGIRNLSEVAVAILEPTGKVSVLRRGQLIDPLLLGGMPNQSSIPRELLQPE